MLPQKCTHLEVSFKSFSLSVSSFRSVPSICCPVSDQEFFSSIPSLSPVFTGLYEGPFFSLSKTSSFRSAGPISRVIELVSDASRYRSPDSASHIQLCLLKVISADGVIFI